MSRDEGAIAATKRNRLLLRAQTGDKDALNTLFESCRPTLFRQAVRILPRPEDAEDAVQEAMVAAFTHFERFQGRSDFLTWATRILINAALQQIRRSRSRFSVSWEQVTGESEGALSGELLGDRQPNPEEHLQRREQIELLADALRNLPIKHLQALELCQFAENSIKEAARTLGVPVSTMKARLHRARFALAGHYKRKTRVRRKSARKVCDSSLQSRKAPQPSGAETGFATVHRKLQHRATSRGLAGGERSSVTNIRRRFGAGEMSPFEGPTEELAVSQ